MALRNPERTSGVTSYATSIRDFVSALLAKGHTSFSNDACSLLYHRNICRPFIVRRLPAFIGIVEFHRLRDLQ